MKNIHKSVFLFCILALMLNSCSNNDEKNDIPTIKDIPELNISDESISVIVDKETNVEITQGGNEYMAFSLNPGIAEVAMDDDSHIIITGKSGGNTFMIVSDQEGQYKKYPVMAYYDLLVLNKDKVDIETSTTKPNTTVVKVIKGNGKYSATSDNDEILTLDVSESDIKVTALKEGDANIIVKDAMGMQAGFSVHITISTNPYNEEEIARIISDSRERYEFEGYKVEKSSRNTFYYGIENGKNKYGWDYYGEYVTILASGDKSVGKKETALLSQSVYGNTKFANEPVHFEVIKNDGSKIWAVYSVIKNEKIYGYLCTKVNP